MRWPPMFNSVAYDRKRYYRAKEELFKKLGNKCAKCGNTDWRVLQIDHIHNNGAEERKYYHSGRPLFDAILKNGWGGYQLLCANCNLIKYFETQGYDDPNVPYKKTPKEIL